VEGEAPVAFNAPWKRLEEWRRPIFRRTLEGIDLNPTEMTEATEPTADEIAQQQPDAALAGQDEHSHEHDHEHDHSHEPEPGPSLNPYLTREVEVEVPADEVS